MQFELANSEWQKIRECVGTLCRVDAIGLEQSGLFRAMLGMMLGQLVQRINQQRRFFCCAESINR